MLEPLRTNPYGPQFRGEDFLRVHIKGENGNLATVDPFLTTKKPWQLGVCRFLIRSLSYYTKLMLVLLNESCWKNAKPFEWAF